LQLEVQEPTSFARIHHSVSLCLNFLICKMGIITTVSVLLISWSDWGDQKVSVQMNMPENSKSKGI
jgi:hypothetical protein